MMVYRLFEAAQLLAPLSLPPGALQSVIGSGADVGYDHLRTFSLAKKLFCRRITYRYRYNQESADMLKRLGLLTLIDGTRRANPE